MANRLQLKRGSGAPGSIFYAGEPMYDESGKILFIGDNGGTGTGAGSSIASNDAYETVLEMLGRTSNGSAGQLKLYEDTAEGTEFVTLTSPALTASYTLTLPTTDGEANQILLTDGSGNLSFSDLISIAADSGTADSVIASDTITFSGTSNEIETAVTDGTITIGLPDDVVITNNFSVGGATTLASNGGITTTGGDLFVGNTLTVKGEFTAEGGADFSGGETTLSSLTVSDLTEDRVLIAGVDGAVEDDANLTYDGTDLTTNSLVVGDLTDNRVLIAGTDGAVEDSANLTYDGTDLTTNSLAVGDLTDNRVLIAGTGGAVEDDANLTYDGTDLTTNSLAVTDLTDGRVLIAGASGAVEDSGNLTFDGTTLTVNGDASVTDLTINGDLRVVGTAVTFETEVVKVEDRVLELGLVDGTEPTATTTWDTGLAFNYFQTSAKKSGVIWLNNQFMAMLSELSDGGGSGNDNPQITATAFAPVAASSLYLGGIAAGNEVINSSQEAVNLIFDGGTY